MKYYNGERVIQRGDSGRAAVLDGIVKADLSNKKVIF